MLKILNMYYYYSDLLMHMHHRAVYVRLCKYKYIVMCRYAYVTIHVGRGGGYRTPPIQKYGGGGLSMFCPPPPHEMCINKCYIY